MFCSTSRSWQWVCMWLYTHGVVVHWWATFFLSTLLVLLSMARHLVGDVGSAIARCITFFVTYEGCASLFCRFSSSCFAWSKERSDHMVVSVMLNSTKNQAIWYNTNVLGMTLWIKLMVVYIMSSFFMSAYAMCKASMSNFTCLGVEIIKQKWMPNWKKNELIDARETNTRSRHFFVLL